MREMPSVAVVVGAARGLGLGLAAALAARKGTEHVAVSCRNPANADELNALAERTGGRMSVHRVAASDEQSVADMAAYLRGRFGRVDTVIHAAGVLHTPDRTIYPETTITKLDADALAQSFLVNAAFPAYSAKHFFPLLRAAAGQQDLSSPPPRFAALSARIGSIGDNRLGGWYSYRASKAALNQLVRTLAVEGARNKPKPILSIGIHPGTCVTDLTAPFRKNVDPSTVRTAERGARDVLSVIDGAHVDVSGRCLAYDGSLIPP